MNKFLGKLTPKLVWLRGDRSIQMVAFDKRLTVVCETKWDETKWKWKSVVCEMGICSLRNGNLYFAKWKSVLCEMEICTLRNGNL